MERGQEMRDEAARKLRIADHMLTMTYPLVKDPKLLIAVLENIFRSMDLTMTSILEREREAKRVPIYNDTFEGRFMTFRQFAERQKIPREILRTMHEMRETISEHKKSPMEFARKGKFVICTESYKVRTLTPDDAKRNIRIAKDFMVMTDGTIA